MPKISWQPGNETNEAGRQIKCSSWTRAVQLRGKTKLFCSSVRYGVFFFFFHSFHYLNMFPSYWLHLKWQGNVIWSWWVTLTLLSSPQKQLEGVARLHWLGFDSSHITLPIDGYRMQLFAWRQELVWYTQPCSALVGPKFCPNSRHSSWWDVCFKTASAVVWCRSNWHIQYEQKVWQYKNGSFLPSSALLFRISIHCCCGGPPFIYSSLVF